MDLKIIAHIYNEYTEKFGIPRQSGIADEVTSTIIFEKPYRAQEALRGIEEYSHLWLLWHFSENKSDEWSPCVRPPRLGGNKRVGVFATRSPFRPNPIGLSSVKLKEVRHTNNNGTVLIVTGADMLSGTPIFDIKPYVSYTDCHSDAVCGFADEKFPYSLKVIFDENLLIKLPSECRPTIIKMLENDPRPAYQKDENRIYFMRYGDFEIKFMVSGQILTVKDVALFDK